MADRIAHAVARYAQRVSTLTALRKNLAGKIRDSLEAALEIDPGHAMTHLMLGIWHADVAAAGFLARSLYGANREDAVHHYERTLVPGAAERDSPRRGTDGTSLRHRCMGAWVGRFCLWRRSAPSHRIKQ